MQKKFFFSSVARRIFLSYLLILVIVLLSIGILSFYWVSHVVEDNEKKSCIASLINTDELLYKKFAALDAFTSTLSKTHWVRKIALINGDKIDYSRVTPTELANNIKELNVYNSLNEFMIKASIYLNEKDMFITTSGYDNSQWFFSHTNKFYDTRHDYWTDLMRNLSPLDSAMILGPLDVCNYWIGNKVFVYLKAIPIVDYANEATLFITIDQRQVQEVLSNALIDKASCIYLLNSQNQVITSVNSTEDFDRIINTVVAEKNGMDFIKVASSHSESFFAFTLTSEKIPMGWKYITLTPVASVMGNVYAIKYAMLLLYSVLFILGIVLCYRAALNSYKPISNLARLLENNIGARESINPAIVKNEYSFIEMGIRSICFRENEAKEKMEKYYNDAAFDDLQRLMHGEKTIEQDGDKLSRITAIFSRPLFCVAIFACAGSQSNLPKVYEDASMLVYAIEQENEIVFAINTNNPAYINEAITQLKCFFGDDATAGIGSAGTIYELSRSYNEACVSLEYKKLKSETGTMNFSDLPLDNKRIFSLPLYDINNILAEQIKEFNLPKIRATLNENLKHLMAYNNLPLSIDRYLFYKQISVCISDLTDQQLKKVIEQYRELSPGKPGQPLVESLFKQICAIRKSSKEEQVEGRQLIDQIQAYIQDHYMEPQMSLNLLAANFSVSSSKICCLFKEHLRESYHDYVSRLRIHAAKVLLQEKQLSIEDISRHVGFESVITFRRLFKKYEELNPSKYKEYRHIKEPVT